MDAFLEAFIHAEHEVCGYRLKPYSAAHVLALSAINSPFAVGVVDPENLTPGNVIAAAKICASREPLKARIKVTWKDRLTFLRMRLWPGYLLQEIEGLNAYITDFFTLPETWRPIDDPLDPIPSNDRVGGPWLLGRILSVISQTSVTLEEALRLPLGQLFWIGAGLAELHGQKVFADEVNELEGLDQPVPADIVAKLEGQRAERMKRRKANGG